jgi:hypothetical protein
LSIAFNEWRYRTTTRELVAIPVSATVIAMISRRDFCTAEKLAPMVGRLRTSYNSMSPEKLGATFRNR